MSRVEYFCPGSLDPLGFSQDGLLRPDGGRYPFLPSVKGMPHPVPNFLELTAAGEGQRSSLAMYGTDAATAMYRNFLDWLFATFDEPEVPWRARMIARLRLRPGDAVLITGCGLGDDIEPILDAVGPQGEVHAQDLSAEMIQAASEHWARAARGRQGQLRFSVGNALRLPFATGNFDAAFHFGGINLFDDLGAGIAEMARVVRVGGRVVVGDEGVAPWLRDTDVGRMVICNNPLWGRTAPIELLPEAVTDVTLDWVLGDCFWVIGFRKAEGPPHINPHILHKGRRGGSMWTRYHGQLEAVSPALRTEVRKAAGAAGQSVHEWLEATLRTRLSQSESSTAIPKPDAP